MKFKAFAVIISLLLSSTVFTATAEASVVGNSVLIHETVISRCGNQFVAFSGVATYGPDVQYLLVDLDGAPVLGRWGEPTNWTVLEQVTTGYHVLTARIHDLGDASKTVAAVFAFTILPCDDGPSDSTSVASNSGGGGGDETDCCPGPDPVDESVKSPIPQVKGVTTKKGGALSALEPLNAVFRFVFGRAPTFTEWKYWADRFLVDKPVWEAILGAMQWHKLHGVTVGQ
ncbi:MAG: hypothetical protein ABIH36_01160 [bacterium]